MKPEFEMEKLRLESSTSKFEKKSLNHRDYVYLTKPGEMFLKGPIPHEWILKAGKLRGKALSVGMELWFWAGLTRSKTIAFNLSRFSTEVGFSRDTAIRGLARLEKCKLVKVKRHPGRKPVVTILMNQKKKQGERKIAKKFNGNGNESQNES